MVKKNVLVVLLILFVLGIAFLGQWYADKKHPNTTQRLETKIYKLKNGVELEMVCLPAGTFQMGSFDDNGLAFLSGRIKLDKLDKNAMPKHPVELSEFWIGKYEVTQEQYKAVTGKNRSHVKGAKNPVEIVSWDDAMAFCKALSIQTGTSFTLPTEAQWEYACRAGSTTDFCYGNDGNSLGEYAWYNNNSGGVTHPVGQLIPNAWGLYDMYGNVMEWCCDYYDPGFYGTPAAGVKDPENTKVTNIRVLRGGGLSDKVRYCRSAYRRNYIPGYSNYPRYVNTDCGFRIVRAQP